MKQITKRLKPGQDLREEIEKIVRENNIQAGCVLSLVGSLSKASLRMAGGEKVKSWDEPLEIVAGTGTISVDGCHIHIAISNGSGVVFGGHLDKGCVVRTTAELVFLVFEDVKYRREMDEETGYDELEVD